MRKFRGVEDHTEGTSKALYNRNRQAAAAGFFFSLTIKDTLGAPNRSCGRCSAAVHWFLWLGLFLDSYGVRLGKEAMLHTVHSLNAWQRWDLLFILLPGTAVRFGGHSYIWYQHSQVSSWHMHFRLKTHQLHAMVFHANGTDHATLEVCIAMHGISFQSKKNTGLGEGNTERRCNNMYP